MQRIIGRTLPEIVQICEEFEGTPDMALKLARAIYRKRVATLDEITDLPKKFLSKLAQQYCVGLYGYKKSATDLCEASKYLFVNDFGQKFETVFMPSEKRKTLCISSQSGCRMSCDFCLTGKLGFSGNLSSADIINQVLTVPKSTELNRIVVMGMGEPFDNFDAIQKALQILNADWGLAFGRNNITISTVGLIGELTSFLLNPLCNLAISLHSPFHEQRMELMPIERTNTIAEVVDIIKRNPLKKPLRVSFEYVALAGINMSEQHAMAIAELIKGIRCHLNIIPWNQHENSRFVAPNTTELNVFIKYLNSFGVLTAVRESRASGINGACGQMAAIGYGN